MIKTIPLSFEEQALAAKSLASGLSNGGFFAHNDALGVLGFVAAFTVTLAVFRKKQKNKWLNILFKMFLSFSILAMFFAMISFDPLTKITGSIDFWTNISQVTYAIAAIITNPGDWWRILLMLIPAIFIPKVIQNLFRKRSWHFNSIGKIFGNLYAGMALSVITAIILVTTKTKKQRDEEAAKEIQQIPIKE